MFDWLIAAGFLIAWLLGIWVGWYGPRPPQLRRPWHYSEADAYTKKYCSDELALASEQARESEGRTMGDKREPKDREFSEREWRDMSMPTEEQFWELKQRVTALEGEASMTVHTDWAIMVERRLAKLEETIGDSPLGPKISEGMPTSLRDVNHATAETLEHTTSTP